MKRVRFVAPCGHTIMIPFVFTPDMVGYFGCRRCKKFFKYPTIPLHPDPGPMRNIRIGEARDRRLPDGPGKEFDTRF